MTCCSQPLILHVNKPSPKSRTQTPRLGHEHKPGIIISPRANSRRSNNHNTKQSYTVQRPTPADPPIPGQINPQHSHPSPLGTEQMLTSLPHTADPMSPASINLLAVSSAHQRAYLARVHVQSLDNLTARVPPFAQPICLSHVRGPKCPKGWKRTGSQWHQ